MKFWELVAIEFILFASFSPVSNAGCLPDKEDVFVVVNYYRNKVYADGKEARLFPITDVEHGFCIPQEARLIAVTNADDQFGGVSLLGSLGERLVTNEDWKCVNDERSVDWYQPEYDDSAWPQAYAKKPQYDWPAISKNALEISSVQNTSSSYFCRGIIKHMKEPFTRSAYALMTASSQRLGRHIIETFPVDDFLQCSRYCLEMDQCVSVNFKKTSEQGRKMCELNSKTNDECPQDMEQRNEFDYYNIVDKEKSNYH